MDKTTAIVLRTTDWSESSRIATLWTRDLGKVRVVAKGSKRLKSAFDSALDLLTVCSIVLIRSKSSSSLDLLTEAQVVRRFARLSTDLEALYAAYYVAEILADGTTDHDPHPELFDEALDALTELNTEGRTIPPRILRFEMAFLRETGYDPMLDHCAGCEGALSGLGMAFSAEAGGALCSACRVAHPDHKSLSASGLGALKELAKPGDEWRRPWPHGVGAELRGLIGGYMTYLRGRPPRLLPYLGS